MAEERKRKTEVVFTVIHDSKKYQVSLEYDDKTFPTLQDLAEAIAARCGIPTHKQKIICRGKTLHEFSSTLNDLGVSPSSKIMVIGKKFDLAEQHKITAIEKVSHLAEELWKKFEEIKIEISGVEQGFLEASQTKDSYTKLTKQVKYLGEGLMKNLESLDAMDIDQSQADAKERRKKAITQVNEKATSQDVDVKNQKYLSNVDAEEDRLKEITSKL